MCLSEPRKTAKNTATEKETAEEEKVMKENKGNPMEDLAENRFDCQLLQEPTNNIRCTLEEWEAQEVVRKSIGGKQRETKISITCSAVYS